MGSESDGTVFPEEWTVPKRVKDLRPLPALKIHDRWFDEVIKLCRFWDYRIAGQEVIHRDGELLQLPIEMGRETILVCVLGMPDGHLILLGMTEGREELFPRYDLQAEYERELKLKQLGKEIAAKQAEIDSSYQELDELQKRFAALNS